MLTSKTKALMVWTACAYAVYHYATTLNQEWHFIDNVDLVIHEAGHVLFMPFGEFMAILGGSLLQVLVPLLFLAYFYRTKQYFSQAIMLLWLAVNLFYIGLYVSDAVRMELPLLGGEAVQHDWNYLLLTLGVIAHTNNIANLVYFAGLVSILLAACIGYAHMKDPDNAPRPLIQKN